MAAEIRPDLLERLRNLARRENRQINELLESLLEHHDEPADKVMPGSLAVLAQAAQKARFRSGVTDVAEHSREILETEFADYLLRRMHEQDES